MAIGYRHLDGCQRQLSRSFEPAKAGANDKDAWQTAALGLWDRLPSQKTEQRHSRLS